MSSPSSSTCRYNLRSRCPSVPTSPLLSGKVPSRSTRKRKNSEQDESQSEAPSETHSPTAQRSSLRLAKRARSQGADKQVPAKPTKNVKSHEISTSQSSSRKRVSTRGAAAASKTRKPHDPDKTSDSESILRAQKPSASETIASSSDHERESRLANSSAHERKVSEQESEKNLCSGRDVEHESDLAKAHTSSVAWSLQHPACNERNTPPATDEHQDANRFAVGSTGNPEKVFQENMEGNLHEFYCGKGEHSNSHDASHEHSQAQSHDDVSERRVPSRGKGTITTHSDLIDSQSTAENRKQTAQRSRKNRLQAKYAVSSSSKIVTADSFALASPTSAGVNKASDASPTHSTGTDVTDIDNIHKWKTTRLQAECRKLGLKTGGSKQVLRDRILARVSSGKEHDDPQEQASESASCRDDISGDTPKSDYMKSTEIANTVYAEVHFSRQDDTRAKDGDPVVQRDADTAMDGLGPGAPQVDSDVAKDVDTRFLATQSCASRSNDSASRVALSSKLTDIAASGIVAMAGNISRPLPSDDDVNVREEHYWSPVREKSAQIGDMVARAAHRQSTAHNVPVSSPDAFVDSGPSLEHAGTEKESKRHDPLTAEQSGSSRGDISRKIAIQAAVIVEQSTPICNVNTDQKESGVLPRAAMAEKTEGLSGKDVKDDNIESRGVYYRSQTRFVRGIPENYMPSCEQAFVEQETVLRSNGAEMTTSAKQASSILHSVPDCCHHALTAENTLAEMDQSNTSDSLRHNALSSAAYHFSFSERTRAIAENSEYLQAQNETLPKNDDAQQPSTLDSATFARSQEMSNSDLPAMMQASACRQTISSNQQADAENPDRFDREVEQSARSDSENQSSGSERMMEDDEAVAASPRMHGSDNEWNSSADPLQSTQDLDVAEQSVSHPRLRTSTLAEPSMEVSAAVQSHQGTVVGAMDATLLGRGARTSPQGNANLSDDARLSDSNHDLDETGARFIPLPSEDIVASNAPDAPDAFEPRYDSPLLSTIERGVQCRSVCDVVHSPGDRGQLARKSSLLANHEIQNSPASITYSMPDETNKVIEDETLRYAKHRAQSLHDNETAKPTGINGRGHSPQAVQRSSSGVQSESSNPLIHLPRPPPPSPVEISTAQLSIQASDHSPHLSAARIRCLREVDTEDSNGAARRNGFKYHMSYAAGDLAVHHEAKQHELESYAFRKDQQAIVDARKTYSNDPVEADEDLPWAGNHISQEHFALDEIPSPDKTISAILDGVHVRTPSSFSSSRPTTRNSGLVQRLDRMAKVGSGHELPSFVKPRVGRSAQRWIWTDVAAHNGGNVTSNMRVVKAGCEWNVEDLSNRTMQRLNALVDEVTSWRREAKVNVAHDASSKDSAANLAWMNPAWASSPPNTHTSALENGATLGKRRRKI